MISKVVEMMKDASENKQIIVTTHNPEIVKYSNKEDVILISRDNSGFSEMYRPIHNDKIKNFLKNDIGMDELYIQRML